MKQERQKKKQSDAMLITLCAGCAQQFFDAGEKFYRADKNQLIKDTCCYCGQHRGWDYIRGEKSNEPY